MSPQVGQQVKIIFRNGTIVEGIVDIWENNSVQLKSLDDKSILIISHPEEDIMLIKLVLKDLSSTEKIVHKIKNANPKPELGEVFAEAVKTHDPTNPDDRKTLAELRIEIAKQEKEIVAQKLREHRPSKASGRSNYQVAPLIYKKDPNGNS